MSLELFNTIALGIIAICCVTFTIIFFVSFIRTKQLLERSSELIEKLKNELAPTTFHLNQLSDDLGSIARSARGDMDRVSSVVSNAEDSINHLIALFQVIQEELESPILKTAAVVSGIRKGFKIFSHEDK